MAIGLVWNGVLDQIRLQRGSKVIIREMHAVFECERAHELGTGHIADQNLQQPTDLRGDLLGDLRGIHISRFPHL